MPEAEVILRLCLHLLSLPGSDGEAVASIDGAHIEVHGSEVFPISAFLESEDWSQVAQQGKNAWQGRYEHGSKRLTVHSKPGIDDVTAVVGSKQVRAECKQGPLVKKPGSREYPKVREAIGQVMTVEDVAVNDVMVVAVPWTEKFQQLVERWRAYPLISRAGIQLVLVGRDGRVDGLHL